MIHTRRGRLLRLRISTPAGINTPSSSPTAVRLRPRSTPLTPRPAQSSRDTSAEPPKTTVSGNLSSRTRDDVLKVLHKKRRTDCVRLVTQRSLAVNTFCHLPQSLLGRSRHFSILDGRNVCRSSKAPMDHDTLLFPTPSIAPGHPSCLALFRYTLSVVAYLNQAPDSLDNLVHDWQLGWSQ